jgi:SAM-dependent methyltransferase
LLYPSAYAPHQKTEQRPAEPAFASVSERYLARHLGYRHLDAPLGSSRVSLAVASRLWDKRRAGVALVPHYVPDGALLEVGCGNGERLQWLRRLGWQHCRGIELVSTAAEQARAAGFQVACGPVEDELARFSRSSFDVIIASMLLEHLYDPFSLVREIAERLKPGGEFLFSTVVRDSVDARMYGPYWSSFDFPRHMVYFRLADIQDMLRDEFQHVERFHQNAPIDFVRSSSWRGRNGNTPDRVIVALGASAPGRMLGMVLARLGLTSRVSFRCRRRMPSPAHRRHSS